MWLLQVRKNYRKTCPSKRSVKERKEQEFTCMDISYLPLTTRQVLSNRECTPLHLRIVSGALWWPLMKTHGFILKPKSKKAILHGWNLTHEAQNFNVCLSTSGNSGKQSFTSWHTFSFLAPLSQKSLHGAPMQKEVANNAYYCKVRDKQYNKYLCPKLGDLFF